MCKTTLEVLGCLDDVETHLARVGLSTITFEVQPTCPQLIIEFYPLISLELIPLTTTIPLIA